MKKEYAEINVRAKVVFWKIGRVLRAIKSFSRCMNINSVSDPAYRSNAQLCKAYQKAASNSMKKAADEVTSSSFSNTPKWHFSSTCLD